MKTLLKNSIATMLATAAICFSWLTSYSQEKFHANSIKLTVSGTSTLHDWEITSNQGKVDAVINLGNEKTQFSGLTCVIPATSLKSGHDLMDKNTYKALDTDKNPTISFVLSASSITPMGNNLYQFKGVGKLTIAGVTQQTEIVATLKYNPADNSFSCTGTKKFNMTDFGVKPPTVMMGTIKTGNAVSITYDIVIKS